MAPVLDGCLGPGRLPWVGPTSVHLPCSARKTIESRTEKQSHPEPTRDAPRNSATNRRVRVCVRTERRGSVPDIHSSHVDRTGRRADYVPTTPTPEDRVDRVSSETCPLTPPLFSPVLNDTVVHSTLLTPDLTPEDRSEDDRRCHPRGRHVSRHDRPVRRPWVTGPVNGHPSSRVGETTCRR